METCRVHTTTTTTKKTLNSTPSVRLLEHSPVRRIPGVFVPGLRAPVPVVVVPRVPPRPRLSSGVPPVAALPRVAAVAALPRLAGIRGRAGAGPGLLAVPVAAVRGPEGRRWAVSKKGHNESSGCA